MSVFDELDKLDREGKLAVLEAMREIEKASGEVIVRLREIGIESPYSDGDFEQIENAQNLVLAEIEKIQRS